MGCHRELYMPRQWTAFRQGGGKSIYNCSRTVYHIPVPWSLDASTPHPLEHMSSSHIIIIFLVVLLLFVLLLVFIVTLLLRLIRVSRRACLGCRSTGATTQGGP